VIQSFGDDATRDLHNGVNSTRVRNLPNEVRERAASKLDRLDAATSVDDLRLPPSHKLHKLGGDLAGFWAISVNKQYRIIFKWTGAGPSEVKLTDYH
jgi:proteic killer suppression protein